MYAVSLSDSLCVSPTSKERRDFLNAPLNSLHSAQGSPRTLLLALVVCLSHVSAKSDKLAEALITKHSVLTPLTAFIQSANTPPDLKAASLNASAQVCVGCAASCFFFNKV